MIAATGRHTIALVREWGTFALFVGRSLYSLIGLRALGAKIIRAIYEMGVRCSPIIVTVGGFTGLVLGLQGYYTLSQFGSESILGSTVALSLVRELGPVLAALMIVGQAGSAHARALIAEPQLILFDEPTTGLDPQRKNSVFTMIAEYRRRFDLTALMVCHDIPEALFVSDRVAWIDGGRIRFVGAPIDLEVATDSDLLEFVHHRNALLSDVAGQRGRSALFAEWPALRRSVDQFVVVTCTTAPPIPDHIEGLNRAIFKFNDGFYHAA